MTIKPEKDIKPEALLGILGTTAKLISLTEEKLKLLKELRRTLARKAISLGLIDGRLKRGTPCPLCDHPTSVFDAMDLACRICKYDARGARAIWERLHGAKS